MGVEPNLYHIEMLDSVDGVTYTFNVLAISLIEAMNFALNLHNEGYSDPPQGLETITVATIVSSGPLFSAPSFDAWYKENH